MSNIYLLLEIQKRELFSKVLLSLEAAEKGHTVYLGKLTHFLLKDFFSPGIVHFKSITPGETRINEMKYLKKKNFILTSIDEEHGVINNDRSYINYRYSDLTLNLVDKVFTWGKFDYKNLVNKYKKFKKKFINSGNPRVDFWNKKFRKFFRKINNKNYENYILFSTNFEGFGYKSFRETLKFHRQTGYFKRGASYEDMLKRYKDSKKLFSNYERTIKKMSHYFKDKEIIIRPHPKDDIRKWKKIFHSFKNIHILNEGNNSDWIANAKLVIHAGCTGGLEASLRNINTISYYPINLIHGHRFADKFSIRINDEKKLFQKIKQVYSSISKHNKISVKLVNERISNYNKNYSHKSIVKVWSNLGKKIITKKNNDFYLTILFLILKIKLKLLNINTDSHKFQKYDKLELYNIIDRLVKVEPKYKSINVSLMSDHIIKFEKKY